MSRRRAIAVLLLALSAPALAGADEMFSFVDADGVIHVTNVPQDPRYRRVRRRTPAREPGVHRIIIQGRRSPPPLLRRESQYDEYIRTSAERHRLPVPLLKAVMAAESNFDPSAVSGKGATGLMQLMPGTARDMYVLDAYDPAQNIEGGARYLRLLHDRFGNDLEKVLAAYNAGPEAVRRSGGAIPPLPETQAYVRKVMSIYESYLTPR